MITDRFTDAVRAFVRELLPTFDYTALYPYTVFSFDDASQTADLQPAAANDKSPVLSHVGARLPGVKVKLLPGQGVLVGFESADPTRPFIAYLDLASTYSTALPAARQGDLVSMPIGLTQALSPSGAPIPNNYTVQFPATPGVPFVAGVGGTAILYGAISSGSVRVKTL